MSKFHAKAPQVTASEGPAHGPYEAAKAAFESMTIRTKGVESTNESPRPTMMTVSQKRQMSTREYTDVALGLRVAL